jgi:predicted dehydrogenase
MRVGYVGLGSVVEGLHLPAWRGVAGAVTVGGADPSPQRRAAWERATGLDAFVSADDLFAAAKPDVVVVATPPDSHAELCTSFLGAGMHVICEKPLATTVDAANRVLDAAQRSGRRVAVNHHFRYQPIFSTIGDRIGSDQYGRLVFCQLSQLIELAAPAPQEQAPWRAEMSDRALLEGGVHLVDLLLFLHDRLPETVYARRSSGAEADATADAIWLLTLDFGGGRLAALTINCMSRAATRYAELRADCERASLRASAGGRALLRIGKERAARGGVRVDWAAGGLAWAEQGHARHVLARNPRQASVRATSTLLEAALAAFETGREPPSSGREARDGLAVIEAAYRSARTGVPVAPDTGAGAGAIASGG